MEKASHSTANKLIESENPQTSQGAASKLRTRRLARTSQRASPPPRGNGDRGGGDSAVMGGSLAEPLRLIIPQFGRPIPSPADSDERTLPMLRRLKDKDLTSSSSSSSKEKTEKLQLIGRECEEDAHNSSKEPKKKDSKRAKFAERIRRSFRRGGHKSLDTKGGGGEAPPPAKPQREPSLDIEAGSGEAAAATGPRSNSQSIVSLTHLPGLGGHVNPALLLDSPEEATPPEFGYHYLSSVATTTNSSNSLDSNLESAAGGGENISYWAWPQYTPPPPPPVAVSSAAVTSSAAMGSELSSSGGVPEGGPPASTGATRKTDCRKTSGAKEKEKLKKQRRLEAPYTPRMEWISSGGGGGSSDSALAPSPSVAASATPSPVPGPTPSSGLTASRSCSITSETSSSTRLGRLHNFLFKSSNESSRSMQGHSNEGFTASSHNSSSGEWEMLAASTSNYGGTLQPQMAAAGGHASDFCAISGSFPEEESIDYAGDEAEGAAGNYTQYTLTSPNNPFLPEITARTYHDRQQHSEDDTLDVNVTSVKWGGGGGGGLATVATGSLSAQYPSPAYSRAGSQESTQSDSAIGAVGRSRSRLPTPKASLAPCSAAAAAGLGAGAASCTGSGGQQPAGTRQKRKLFSMNSPTRLLHHRPVQQKAASTEKPPPPPPSSDKQAWLFSAMSSKASTLKTSASTGKLRSFNPFSSQSSQSSSSTTPAKRVGPTKQAAVTSPGPPEAEGKRICLLLPPLSNKLQIKSKSLTHLDGLDPTGRASCLPPGASANPEGFPKPRRSRADRYEQNLIGDYIGPNDAAEKGPSASMAAAADYAYTGTLHPFSYANMSVFSRTLPPPGRVAMAATRRPIRARSASPLYTFRQSYTFMCCERSASEYFAVSFCNEHGYQEEEFIPARFGVRLAPSLQTALKRRNLTFSDVYVIYSGDIAAKYIETGQISSQDALREDTDVGGLGGMHLVILERNPNKQTIQKAAAFGVRPHPPVLATGVSTDEPPVEPPAPPPPPPPKPIVTSKSMPKNYEQTLLDRLNRVYRNGATPTLRPHRLPFQHPQLKEALAYLDCVHTSWRDFIPGLAEDDPEAQIQTAIWELVSTEASYIRAMQVVTDLFMCCLEAIQVEDVLREVNLCDLFSNARQIVEVNLRFWTFYMFPMVSESLGDHRPMRYRHLIDGFTAFPSIFEAYKVFCAEQTKCQHYCKELNRFNAQFTSYLSWCESQKACNRLRLADLLVRPMQRLTKYSLLLAAIKKHMFHEADIVQMENMIEIVDTFVFSVNVHLTTCQETERLKGVMARIESYDVIDAHTDILQRLVDVHSTMFDLTGPMIGCAHHHSRHLFMEGDHKFKDSQSKSDVHCFLFTDILLICKSVSKKHSETLKVIRQPYFTDRLSMHLNEAHNIISCVYLNEFNVATAGFTLQSSEAKSWYDAFRRAKNIYMRLKQSSNCWEGLRFVGLGGTTSMSQTDGLNMNKLMAVSASAHTTAGPGQQGGSNSCNGSFEWNDARQMSMETENTTWNEEDQSATKKTKKKPKQAKQPPKTRTGWPLNLLNLGQSLPNLTTTQSNPNFYHTYSNNTLHVPGTAAAAAAGTSQSGNLLLSPEHRGKSYPPPSPNRVPLRRGDAFSNSSKNPPLVKTRNITSQQASDGLHLPATPASSPNKPAGSQTSLLRSVSVNEGGSASDRELPTSSNSSLQSTPQPHYAPPPPPPLGVTPPQLQPPPITMSSSSNGGGGDGGETTTTIQLYSPGPRGEEGAEGGDKQGETFV